MNRELSLYKPEYPGDPRKEQAHTLYVHRGYIISDIASIVDSTPGEIEQWIEDDGWVDRREKMLSETRTAAATYLGRETAVKSGRLLDSFLGLQQKLMEQIARLNLDLDKDPEFRMQPREISMLSNSLKRLFDMYQGMLENAGITKPAFDHLAETLAKASAPTQVQVNILNSLRDEIDIAKQEGH